MMINPQQDNLVDDPVVVDDDTNMMMMMILMTIFPANDDLVRLMMRISCNNHSQLS
jgi:hypothetical protein